MKKIISCLSVLAFVFTLCVFTACSSEDQLKMALDAAREELVNQPAEDGVKFTDLTLGADAVVYTFEFDESEVTVEQLKSDNTILLQMKNVAISTMKENCREDVDVKKLVEMCVECNRGILYKYVGNVSGETLKINISKSELERMLE